MKRWILWLAAAGAVLPIGASAAEPADPIGALLSGVASRIQPFLETVGLKATLYHSGAGGVGTRDALGCKVVPMRTAAVDSKQIPKGTLLYIRQTVGMPLPNGGVHDGYWYASDTGGAIHKGRIDLFTGATSASMTPLMTLNLTTLTVTEIGKFSGCPHE
ncbi:MAG TPA: 3D domain-containing protein [Caulobacteraceae bacterium]|nr:3D domain-containing protein [Caulobacteraceae bacterium]